jgi:hypothetical protein
MQTPNEPAITREMAVAHAGTEGTLLKTITKHVTLAARIIVAFASLPPIAKADESPKEHPALRR